jgi:hypothetical protein
VQGYLFDSVALVNGVATSKDIGLSVPGTFCFRAEYVGDAQWAPSSDGGPNECVTATAVPDPTTTVSKPSRATITLGEFVNDTANVTPQDTSSTALVTGAVHFYLCSPDFFPCTKEGYDLGNVTLVNGQATSVDVRPSLVGLYCFRAEFEGNDDWAPSEDASLGECVNVLPAERIPTTTNTTPSNDTIPVGQPVTDHANVTVAMDGVDEIGTPTGNVSFYVCAVNVVPCAAGGTFLGNATLDGGNATSPPFTPTAPGTYCFRAEYAGDAEYAPSQDARQSECFTATMTIPFFPTTAALALGLLGTVGVLAAVMVMRRRQA